MRRLAIAAAISILAFGTLACAAESPDVPLGAILSLTGSGAPYGNSIQRGVDLAVEEINAAGGINVEGGGGKPIALTVHDTQSDAQVGVQRARELIEGGTVAVIGAVVSDVTLAIAPLFEEAEVILISPASSTPKLSDAGIFIYRNFPSDDLEALNTADYIFNKSGLREAAVIAQQSEFGLGQKNAFIQRFRLLGGREVGQESYPVNAGADDYQRVAESIAAAVPPAVYIAGYTEDTAAMAAALRAAGVDSALFGTGAVLADALVAAAPGAVDGLIFPQPSFDRNSEEDHIRQFVAAYEAAYGARPDVYAAHGYDAVKLLALAIQESGTDAQELRFYLNSMNPYPGVTGSTDFDDNGDVRKFHRMYQIQAGAGVPLEN